MLDGAQSPLAALSSAVEAPLAVAFVVCLNRTQRPGDVSETIAAMAALADGLTRPGDRAALVACGDRARIVLPWSAPADVRRALDALRATDDEANEADALRLAAALPVTGARRIAIVRTDGRHLDPATEGDLAAAGLPVFPLASPGTADVLPLVTLARATGGAYLDGDPAEVLSGLRDRLRASWQLDIAAPDSLTPTWFSVRVGAVASARVRVALPTAGAPGAPTARPSDAPGASDAPSVPASGPRPLTWLALGALVVAAAVGWVFFGRRPGRPLDVLDDLPDDLPEDASAEMAEASPGASSPARSPEPRATPGPAAASIAAASIPAPSIAAAAPWLHLTGAAGVALASWRLDRACVVGRSAEADLRLADPSVSSRHAEIWFDGARVRVRDLGSTNGLRVDGQVVREAEIRSGSRLTFGETVVVATLDFGM